MKRWAKPVLGGVVCLVMIEVGMNAWQRHRDRLQIQAVERADEEQLKAFRAEFPLNSTVVEVHSGLRTRNLDAPDYEDELDLHVGQQPSLQWFCGPYDRYIQFRFVRGSDGQPRLQSIARSVRGLNCL